MHSFILKHRSTRRLGCLHYFVLRIPERPFSGLIGEAAPPLVKFTPAFWRGWHLTIIVLFLKAYLNNLNICLHFILSRDRYGHSLDGPSLFFGVLLIYFSVRRFTEKSPKLSEFFLIVLLKFSNRGSKDVGALVECL